MKLGKLPLPPILPVLFSYLDQPQASHTSPCPLTFCSPWATPNAFVVTYLLQINVDHISFHFYFLNNGSVLQLE